MIPTVNVTATLTDQSGVPQVGARITAILDKLELYQGIVVPKSVNAITGIDGRAVLVLFPNALGSQASLYTFKITTSTGKNYTYTGFVPNNNCNLFSIVNTPAYPGKPDGQLAIESAISASANAAASAASVGAAAAAAATSATAASASATTATTKATAASASATTATTKATEASASATTATTKATEASASANATSIALQASLAASDILPSVNKTFFTSANLVDIFIYDTKKDSDGGAWRKRCTQTSWYNEPLAGNYLGEAANETAARALTGAVAGSYFHNTTDGLFYSLNATAGVTQIYRGGRADFPEQVIVTAEAGRVILWDATQAAMPMWMVFVGNVMNMIGDVATGGGPVASLYFLNGSLLVGQAVWGLADISFIRDRRFLWYLNNANYLYNSGIVSRNSGASHVIVAGASIINNAVKSVAATVLPNAPIDPATGIAIPTIAVGTAGGVSVIKADGTVSSSNPGGGLYDISFTKTGGLWVSGGSGVAWKNYYYADTSLVSAPIPFSSLTIPSRPGTDSSTGVSLKNKQLKENIAFVIDGGFPWTQLLLMRHSPASLSNSMLCSITNTYNSGWQVGDIRRSWLADSTSAVVANPATEADRSVKNMPITVMGSIVKSAALGGRSLYTGFSATNFLQEASHADWNALGAGDFSILLSGVKWGTLATLKTLLSLGSGAGAGSVEVQHLASNQLAVLIHNGTALAAIITTAAAFADAAEHTLEIKRGLLNGVASTLQILVDGVVVASAVSVLTISNTTGFFRVGEAQAASRPWAGGQCANVRISATAPSADQSLYIATQENSIGANACILAGTSTSVTALAYDDAADLLHCATSWGRSTFSGLVRTASEATTLGAPKAMAAFEGVLVQAGATGAKVYVPAKYVRDELARAAEQAQKLGQPLVSQDYVATASQTAFVLPIGYTPKFVYQQGLLKRFATGAGNWSSSWDGFRWTVTLGTGAALNDVVSILTTRD